MTGLADVYEGDVGRLQSRRRVRIGVGLLTAGLVLSFVSIVIATTDLVAAVDGTESRLIAGVIGGLGVPAILGGVATVLPANPKLRVAAVIGASIAVLGVTMFWNAYPEHWAGYGDQLTPYVVGVYFLGIVVLVTCLFAGLVTLKRRNDPGGTVSLNITREGDTKIVEVDRSDASEAGTGGIGFLGGTPDGDVDTQTNRTSASGQSGKTSHGGSTSVEHPSRGTGMSHRDSGPDRIEGPGRRTPTSDGGAVDDELRSPSRTTDAEVIESESGAEPDLADRYCGNCAKFQYVRTERGMQPYCGETEDVMDDMDACDEWTPNS